MKLSHTLLIKFETSVCKNGHSSTYQQSTRKLFTILRALALHVLTQQNAHRKNGIAFLHVGFFFQSGVENWDRQKIGVLLLSKSGRLLRNVIRELDLVLANPSQNILPHKQLGGNDKIQALNHLIKPLLALRRLVKAKHCCHKYSNQC